MGVNPDVLLIGVGNEFRSDDGLGILAAREIRRRNLPGVVVVEQTGEGAALMEAWKGFGCALIIDAIDSGGAPGTVHRLDALAEEIPARFYHHSSHAFGVVEAIAVARPLGLLPDSLLLFGIEGSQFDVGPGLTDAVLRNMPALLSSIERELHTLRARTQETPA